jgi:hypothetical protein
MMSDDGQGPAIGVSSGRTVRPVAASFMFPSTMESLQHVPERWTDNGEEVLVPDPEHPFATNMGSGSRQFLASRPLAWNSSEF